MENIITQADIESVKKSVEDLEHTNTVIRQAIVKINTLETQLDYFERENARLRNLVERLRQENRMQMEMLNDLQEPFRNEDYPGE